MMNISSRTPEGSPNRCTVCSKSIQIEPSLPFGDAPCPSCGTLLWFIVDGDDRRLFAYDDSEELRERATKAVADVLGVDEQTVRDRPQIWKESGGDSLDLVELAMEMED